MAKKKRQGLIRGNLERISSKVFIHYHDEITELVSKQHGVYALYKRDRLYSFSGLIPRSLLRLLECDILKA